MTEEECESLLEENKELKIDLARTEWIGIILGVVAIIELFGIAAIIALHR